MNLCEKQLKFLEEELSISKENIEKMSEEEWTDVREKCFYIEADELLDIEADELLDMEDDEFGDMEDDELLAMEYKESMKETERCRLATSIADITFSDLKINI